MSSQEEMSAETAWQNLEAAVAEVYAQERENYLLLETVAAAIYLLFDFPPSDIIAQAEGGELPAKSAVSWLVHEAKNIKQIDAHKVTALEAAWLLAHPGEELIRMPLPKESS